MTNEKGKMKNVKNYELRITNEKTDLHFFLELTTYYLLPTSYYFITLQTL